MTDGESSLILKKAAKASTNFMMTMAEVHANLLGSQREAINSLFLSDNRFLVVNGKMRKIMLETYKRHILAIDYGARRPVRAGQIDPIGLPRFVRAIRVRALEKIDR
jgi:hypothetical protein